MLSTRRNCRTDRSAPRWYRPAVEALEDRTLLSVGAGLNDVFGALQNSLNDHLLKPNLHVPYSLPLVGLNLGKDTSSRFLSAIGKAVNGVSDPAALAAAIPANGGTVTVNPPGGSQTDYEIKIAGGRLNFQDLLFDLGLPGLTNPLSNPLTAALQNLESKLKVNADLTYNVDVFFTVDSAGNVTLDTQPNQQMSTPIVGLDLNVSFDAKPFHNLTVNLGALTVKVDDSGTSFNPSMQLNVVAKTYPADCKLDLTGAASTLAFSAGHATLGLKLTVQPPANTPLPGLVCELGVNWELGGTSNAFDDIKNDPQQPALSFNVFLDVSSISSWLNSTIIGQLAQKFAPLAPTIDSLDSVLNTQVPIIGAILPGGGTLAGVLGAISDDSSAVQHIADFIGVVRNIIDGVESISQDLGSGMIPLVSINLPDPPADDPRLSSFDLGSLLDGLAPYKPSKDAQDLFDGKIHNALPGDLEMPLLINPLDDLKALVLGENVVLVQWQYALPKLSAFQDLGTIPIFPPLALGVNLEFGFDAGFTIGYDTYGFTTGSNTQQGWDTDPTNDGTVSPLLEGVFIQDVHLNLTGSIELDAVADLGIVQIGGGGSLTVGFGIQGVNAGTAVNGSPPVKNLGSDIHPCHVAEYNGASENVLQWGDLVHDLQNGPLCPFVIGGDVSIGLNAFVSIGIGPFSVTFHVDFGSITLATFTIDTCGVPFQPHLAETDGNSIDTTLSANTLPNEGAVDTQFMQEATEAGTSYGGTHHWLLIDAGQFASLRNVGNDPANPPTSEMIEILPDKAKTGLNVQGFGVQQPCPNDNTHDTTILVFGNPGPGAVLPLDVTADAGVHANVYWIGGYSENHLNYQGDGIAYLRGGDEVPNTLVGGTYINELVGGGGIMNDPKRNVLLGGTGHNTLRGGLEAATLIAGPNSGDRLIGGQGNFTYVMDAGPGDDSMTGGPNAYNEYQWAEGDGNLAIQGQGDKNELVALGKHTGESWNISQDAQGQAVVATPDGKTIRAQGLETLDADSSDAKEALGDSYTVGDLSHTSVRDVNLNLHAQANPDHAPDQVAINAPPTADTVEMFWDYPTANINGDTVSAALSHVQIDTQLAGDTQPGRHVVYAINLAVPKPSDTLKLNTGPAADVVNVHSTQPDVTAPNTGGHVYVTTGGGDDQITVGSPTLDSFLGPLDVDAGAGHNQIAFDEHASAVRDTATLTATQLIRYTQPPTVTSGGGDTGFTETAYPFIINYKATGGDFADGVSFSGSQGSTDLYVPETGANAPTTVNANGGLNQSHANVRVGYDGAYVLSASHLVQNIFVNQPLATTAGSSTLNLIRSPLTVNGNGGKPQDVLELDDQGLAVAANYTLTGQFTGQLKRTTKSGPVPAPIAYVGLAVVLDAGNHGNQILVEGMPASVSATINTGNGKNAIFAGFDSPGLNVLDQITGTVTVVGGTGMNALLIDDQGNGAGQKYQLGTSQVVRLAGPQQPAVTIHFQNMDSVGLEASNTNGINALAVDGTPKGVPVNVDPGTGPAVLDVVDLDATQGPLNFQWSTGTKSLGVNDQAASADGVYQLTSTPLSATVQRNGAALVSCTGALHSLLLAPGQLNSNNISIVSLAPGTSATILTGQANNLVTVAPGHTLNVIGGPLSIVGNGPTQVTLDDRAAAAGRDYQVTAAQVQFSAVLPPIKLAAVSAILFNTAPSATAEVRGTAKGTALQFILGKGKSQVIVGSLNNSLAPIQGVVGIFGQSGSDTLRVNDQSGVAMASYTVGANGITTGTSAAILFLNLGSVMLNGSGGEDAYLVTGVPAKTPVTVNGQGTNNFLTGPNQTNQWTFTGADAGTLDSTIHFNHIQSIMGGSGADALRFQQAATLSGRADGGAGADTLDFSGYGSAVAVSLHHGATGFIDGVHGTAGPIASGFSNIDAVAGKSTDTLDSAGFAGNFDADLQVNGMAPLTLVFPLDFTGGLTAATINNITINGNFTGQIIATTFGTLSVGGMQAPTAHVWLQRAGSFAVANGALVGQSAANVATINGASFGDVSVRAAVALAAGQSVGLVARYSGPGDNNMYLAQLTAVGGGFQVVLYRVQNGAKTKLAISQTLPGGTGTLEFDLSGTSLKVLFNNSLVASATDSTLTTGAAGVRTSAGAQVSNVTAA